MSNTEQPVTETDSHKRFFGPGSTPTLMECYEIALRFERERNTARQQLAEARAEGERLKGYLAGTPAAHTEAIFQLAEELGFGPRSSPPVDFIRATVATLTRERDKYLEIASERFHRNPAGESHESIRLRLTAAEELAKALAEARRTFVLLEDYSSEGPPRLSEDIALVDAALAKWSAALLAFRSSTPAPAPAPDKLKKETKI